MSQEWTGQVLEAALFRRRQRDVGCGGRMRPRYAADLNARYSIFVNDMGPKAMIKVALIPARVREWERKGTDTKKKEHDSVCNLCTRGQPSI